MPVDESDSVREDETTYFRVRDDGIASTEDLRSRLEEVFTPELAEEIFNKGQYRDFDGRLYAVPGGRGTNIYFLDKTVQAERLSEDRWEVTLTFWAYLQPYGAGAGDRLLHVLSDCYGRIFHNDN